MTKWMYNVEFSVTESGISTYKNSAFFTSTKIAEKKIKYLYKSLKRSKIIPNGQTIRIPKFPTPERGLFLEELNVDNKTKASKKISFKVARKEFLEDEFSSGMYDKWIEYVNPIVTKKDFEIIDFIEIDEQEYKVICSKKGNFLYVNYYIFEESKVSSINNWVSMGVSENYQGGRDYLWDLHEQVIEKFPKYLINEILPYYYSKDWIHSQNN